MKVALVHDDLVQWGGAERVLIGLSKIFPEAVIYTSVFDSKNKILAESLAGKKIVTSFMQKIPFWKTFYKALLPIYPIAFEQFDFSDFDLVISNTTRFAKCVITKPGTTHICYCHTPPRFLYGYSGENPRIGWYFNHLRQWDKIWSKRVDYWVAGSKNAQDRIQAEYGAESKVIYPFVDEAIDLDSPSFDGGYLLVISRLNRYKRVDLAIELSNKYKIPLKIIGTGPEMQNLMKESDHNIQFLGKVEEKMLKLLISGCKALVVCGEEDFGLTPLEAQIFGKPVLAFKKGGTLETVTEGKTGYLFETQNLESLSQALVMLEKSGYNVKECKNVAERFSFERFKTNWQEMVKNVV